MLGRFSLAAACILLLGATPVQAQFPIDDTVSPLGVQLPKVGILGHPCSPIVLWNPEFPYLFEVDSRCIEDLVHLSDLIETQPTLPLDVGVGPDPCDPIVLWNPKFPYLFEIDSGCIDEIIEFPA